MQRLPGWLIVLVVLGAVCVGTEHMLAAAPDDRVAKQGASEAADHESRRAVYQEHLMRLHQQIDRYAAELRAFMLEHPGSAVAELQALQVLQEARVAVVVELAGAEATYARYRDMLEMGDFSVDSAVMLEIEQSPRMLEIDRELRQLRYKRVVLADEAGDRHRVELGRVEVLIGQLSMERDEVFDRMARYHFNAAVESSAHRVMLLRDQAEALDTELAEARVRYEDSLRTDTERTSIERAILMLEARRDVLSAQFEALELEADLDDATR